MTVPDFQTMLRPILVAAAHGARSTEEYRQYVIESLDLSDADVSEKLPSGTQTRLANRVYWSLIHLERADLLERIRRGIYVITDQGKGALSDYNERIDIKALKTFPAYRNWQARYKALNGSEKESGKTAPMETGDNSQTPVEKIEGIFESIEEDLSRRVIQRVLQNSWQFFEGLVVDILLAMGYGGGRAELAQALKTTSDHGIDGIIKQDPLGLDIVYVQAKRHGVVNNVGRPAVQGFSGALDDVGAHKGVLITTSSFSSGAVDYANRIAKRLILVDGKTLAQYMMDHGVGVRVKSTYSIRDIDEDYFPI
jgi:restriction system protein